MVLYFSTLVVIGLIVYQWMKHCQSKRDQYEDLDEDEPNINNTSSETRVVSNDNVSEDLPFFDAIEPNNYNTIVRVKVETHTQREIFFNSM